MKKVDFTLTEVLAVVVLLVILFSGLASSLSQADSTSEDLNELAQVEALKSHLRYLQTKVLSDDLNDWVIRFSSDSYNLVRIDLQGNETLFRFPAADTVDIPTTLSYNFDLNLDDNATPESDVTFEFPNNQNVLFLSGSGRVLSEVADEN